MPGQWRQFWRAKPERWQSNWQRKNSNHGKCNRGARHVARPPLASAARRAGYIYIRISPFLENFAVREEPRGCTSAGLHSRRVEDNTPYLLGSGYADLELTRPASTK